MKTNLIFSLLGATFGAILIGVAYLFFPYIFTNLALSSGSQFNSIDDLRGAMLKRDSRDTLADGSVSLRSMVQPHPSDQIIYILRPAFSGKFQHVPVKINSLSMRNNETTIQKPNNVYRIAVLGDSYTFGWGVEQDQVFSQYLESELNKQNNGNKRVEVLNFGVPGYATFQEVAYFLEEGFKFKPDAVLVYFINNDFGLPFFIKDINGTPGLKSATQFNTNLKASESKESQAKRKALLQLLDANRALVNLGKFGKSNNIKIFLTIHPDKDLNAMRNRLWSIRNNPGLLNYIDISRDYTQAVQNKLVPLESLSLPHDHHPGPGAHKLIGTILAQRLINLLY